MMDCHQVQAEFSALLDGELSSEEQTAVESHLADCAVCLRKLEGYRRVSALYASLEKVAAPADFEARMRARLGPKRLWLSRVVHGRPLVPVLMAAAVLALTVAGLLQLELMGSGAQFGPTYEVASEHVLEHQSREIMGLSGAPEKATVSQEELDQASPARARRGRFYDAPAPAPPEDDSYRAGVRAGDIAVSAGNPSAEARKPLHGVGEQEPQQQSVEIHEHLEGLGYLGAATAESASGSANGILQGEARAQLQAGADVVENVARLDTKAKAEPTEEAGPISSIDALGSGREMELTRGGFGGAGFGLGGARGGSGGGFGAGGGLGAPGRAADGVSDAAGDVAPGDTSRRRELAKGEANAAEALAAPAPPGSAPAPMITEAAEESPLLRDRPAGEMAVVTATRTLHFREGVWVQRGYEDQKLSRVQRDSSAWERLVGKDETLRAFEALEAAVIFRVGEQWYRLEAPAGKK